MAKDSEVVKKPRLTTKQAKYVKAKAEGMNGTDAAIRAYGVDKKTASVISSQNLNKLSIQEALHAEFTKQGITLEAIVKPIKDGLTAERTVIIGKENDAFADQVPDHSIRLKASGMAAQFIGLGKTSTVEGGIHFHNHAEEKKTDYDL